MSELQTLARLGYQQMQFVAAFQEWEYEFLVLKKDNKKKYTDLWKRAGTQVPSTIIRQNELP